MSTWTNHGFFARQYWLNPCMQRGLGKRMSRYRAGEEDYAKDYRKLDCDETKACQEHHADNQQTRARRI